jgi:hypothetical protein
VAEGSVRAIKRSNDREQRDPAVCTSSGNTGSRGEMTKTPELVERRYRPAQLRRVEIPKRSGSKGFRLLSIPTIRDRVVQGALKLILEPIFEAVRCRNRTV